MENLKKDDMVIEICGGDYNGVELLLIIEVYELFGYKVLVIGGSYD